MKPKFILFLTVFFITNYNLFGQPILSTSADTITVEAEKLNFKPNQIVLLDSNNFINAQTANLAQVLSQQTNIFIKEYGLGTLATAANRGGGAAQTQLLWEGVNIQNPMLGQTDLNLLPIFLVDNISVQNQENSSLIGSNGTGGAIFLEGKSPNKKGWGAKIGLNYGSFNQYKQHLQLNYATDKDKNISYAQQLKIYNQQAENNFIYKDINAFGANKPLLKMANNQANQLHILSEQYLNVNKYQLTVKLWLMSAQRNLPPTLLQTYSDEQQQDKSLRLVIDQNYNHKNKHFFKYKNSFIGENLLFKSAAVFSKSYFYNYFSQLAHKFLLGSNHLFSTICEYNYLFAQADGYQKNPVQHRLSLANFYKYIPKKDNFKLYANYRIAWVNPNFKFYAWGLNFVCYPLKNSLLNIGASQNYRLPTFNDWFWAVGGNPNLKAEKTYQFFANYEQKNQFLRFKLELFYNIIDNYIAWQPDNRSGLWAVFNLNKVINRGANVYLDLFLYQNKKYNLNLQLQQNYAYTRSSEADKLALQLLYVPVHKYNLGLNINYKSINLIYSHNFTSRRYLENSNANFLVAYQVANLYLGFIHKNKTFWGQVYNLYNVDYQIMANRPMPRVWVEMGFKIEL